MPGVQQGQKFHEGVLKRLGTLALIGLKSLGVFVLVGLGPQ